MSDRILISGVGRSGTTLLYQQLSNMLLRSNPDTRLVYEPYLWNIDVAETKTLEFGSQYLHPFGIHCHTASPLFLDGDHEVHDDFIRHVFPERASGESAPTLVKVIRGAGRLRAFLSKVPDLKIICSVRNPLDVINSSFGLFSLTGEEFHLSDVARLKSEWQERNGEASSLPDSKVGEALLWWSAMTEAMLDLTAEFPDQVYCLPYEATQINGVEAFQSLVDWLGIGPLEEFMIGAKRVAGAKTSNRFVANSDVVTILPFLEHYLKNVLSRDVSDQQVDDYRDDLLKKYSLKNFAFPVASHPFGNFPSIRLRSMLVKRNLNQVDDYIYHSELKFTHSKPQSEDLVKAAAQKKRYKLDLHTSVESFGLRKSKQTFGCVVAACNCEKTIAPLLVSLLEQTRPYDEIVVVDDGSKDKTREIVKRFADRYGEIKLLELPVNGGVSSARHFGYSALQTDFATQIDSDDYAFPSKNEFEADVLLDDPDAVAFSDIGAVMPDDLHIWETHKYAGDSKQVFFNLLGRENYIPRDIAFKRQLYFDVGGYTLWRELYEDWEFKLLLAATHDGRWKRTVSPVGTFYDRRNPGLSKSSGKQTHGKEIFSIFLRAAAIAKKNGRIGSSGIQEAFDLLKTNVGNHVDPMGASGQDMDFSRIDMKLFSDVLENRRVRTLEQPKWIDFVRSVARSKSADVKRSEEVPASGGEATDDGDKGMQHANAIIEQNLRQFSWSTDAGFGKDEAPHPRYDEKRLFWQNAEKAKIRWTCDEEVAGLKVRVYIPHIQSQEITVRNGQAESDILVSKVNLTRSKKTDGSSQPFDIDVMLPRPARRGSLIIESKNKKDQKDGRVLYSLLASVVPID